VFNDEAGVMFGGYAFNQDNRLKTIAALSQLWERGEFDRARAGEGRDRQFGKRLSCHLMIQPAAISEALNDVLLSRQGFWPRFLLAWPEPGKPREARPFEPDRDSRVGHFWSRCTTLLDRPVIPAPDGGLELPMLEFSEGARARIGVFFEVIEKHAYAGRYSGELKPFAKRAAEQVCRIASVLTLFDDSEAKVVQADAVLRATELVAYSLETWLGAFGQKEEAVLVEYANRLHAWLRKQALGATESAMLHAGPKPRSRGLRDAALSLLETKGRAIQEGGKWRAL
jgi:hypothetical protein